MTDTTVAFLRAAAIHAASRYDPRISRAILWQSRRDAYINAARVADRNTRKRALLLAQMADHRMAAWTALAEGEPEFAIARWLEAVELRREAAEVPVC